MGSAFLKMEFRRLKKKRSWVQLVGLGVVYLWVGLTTSIMFGTMNKLGVLRVQRQEEEVGGQLQWQFFEMLFWNIIHNILSYNIYAYKISKEKKRW